MSKILSFMHVSLDGFVCDSRGSLDWTILGEEMWDYVNEVTAICDAALYGSVTYQMMEEYWPTAGDQPDASKHDKDYSKWANSSKKFVFSNTLKEVSWEGTTILNGDLQKRIEDIKQQVRKNVVIFGSPSLLHSMMKLGLVDELYINVNPVILGFGKSLFSNLSNRINAERLSIRDFKNGVVGLHYKINY